MRLTGSAEPNGGPREDNDDEDQDQVIEAYPVDMASCQRDRGRRSGAADDRDIALERAFDR